MLYPHVVNNCIKRHINIPTYSTSTENVYLDEYVNSYPQPVMNSGVMYQQPTPNHYQGNVGTETLQQMNPYNPNFGNFMNPFNN